ncbi:MAG TPA: hypothetical protein DDW65_07085 [Firmicutes bacterium]|jgi:hypothetical protein|nr:hypothetical protein [Bacillota bacterium]
MKKIVIVLFLAVIFAVSLVGCGGGSGSGGSSSGSPSQYAGTWTGSWTLSDGEYGTAYITISDSGAMSGYLRNSSNISTTGFSGQITGSAVSLSYQYSWNTSPYNCSGTVGSIVGNRFTINFSFASGSSDTGTCTLTKQ